MLPSQKPPYEGALHHLVAQGKEEEVGRDYEGGTVPAENLERAGQESWHFPFKSQAAQARVALRISVEAVSAGKSHTLILTGRHEVWSFGSGHHGQLGHSNRNTYQDPQFIRALHGVKVHQVECGAYHSFALTEEGTVYSWGLNRTGQLGFGDVTPRDAPSVLPFSGTTPVSMVAAGERHTVFLAKDGMVWTCGDNKYGQIGHGEHKNRLEPKMLQPLRSVGMKHVAAGLEHSLVVSQSGDVWSFGRNQHYQLGHKDTEDRKVPTLVDSLVCYWVEVAEAGEFHSLFLTEEQDVLVFGTGENGQLGIGPKKRVAKSPAIIAKLSNQDIVKIRCGMTHNLAITSTGDIFSWGCGLLGRLGHGNQRNVFYPRRMALLHQFSVERDTHDYPFAKITPPKELTVKDSEEAELTRMANAITSVPYHLQREFTDAELVEFKRCFDQIDVDRSGSVDASEMGEALQALGETLPKDDILRAINEVDANNNGEIEFDEFVQMIFNMRSGVSEVSLAMVYRTVPQGNEISKDALDKLVARAEALWTANRRLEARRVFWGIDEDNSGEIDASELRAALLQLGLRTTPKEISNIIRDFDDNNNGTVDVKEFLAHFDAVTENSKKKKGIQWFLQAVTTYRHKSTERVAPVAASRFARTFRRRCDKMGVVIKELLDARLTSLPTDPLVSRGILNLEEMRLRDTHVIALAFTLKAVPIFWDLRLSGNYITDAGMNALIRALEFQMHDANFIAGAGGATKVVDAKLRPQGWAVAESRVESDGSGLEGIEEDDPWDVRTGRKQRRASSRGSSTPRSGSRLSHRHSDGRSIGGRSVGSHGADVVHPFSESKGAYGAAGLGGGAGAVAAGAGGNAGAGSSAAPDTSLAAMRKAMKSLRSFDDSDDEDASGTASAHMQRTLSYSLKSGGGANTPSPVSAAGQRSFRGAGRKQSKHVLNRMGSSSSAALLPSKSKRRLTQSGLNALSRTPSGRVKVFSPAKMFTASQRDLMRHGVRSHDIVTCSNCGATDTKTEHKPGGKADKFVVFANITQCRNCDHEWMQPVHYVSRVDVLDPMKPERLLAIGKVRLQNMSRNRVHWILSHKPRTLEQVRLDHEGLVQAEVDAFAARLQEHHTSSASADRLEAELARYGISCFHTHEVLYHRRIKTKVEQHTAAVVNELATKMRVLYRALVLPLEWPKLLDAAKKEQESSKGELELRMHGWTVKPEFFEAGYKKLNDLGLKVVEHYRDILRHVTVVDAGAGYTHSCALTVPGELWTFGDATDGRIGHGADADGIPQLVPRVVLLARPSDERELVGGVRLQVLDCSAKHRCDAGRIAENVRAGGYVVWDSVMAPPEATVLRVRLWADRRGAVEFREDGLDGPIVAQIVVTPTQDQWTTMTARVRVKKKRQVVNQLFAIFNSDNACRMEWVEFVSPAPGSKVVVG